MATTCDIIVIGTGGVGSAALFHLARRGIRVLGLDRFAGGHDRGSSHGHTRMIRQAYFEHPSYVPLVLRAYDLWADLEQEAGRKLFHQVGLIEIGPPDGVVLSGTLKSAGQHGLDVSQLTARDVQERYPGLFVPDNMQAVFEAEAGYLLVERSVVSHLELARRAGAELRTGVTVRQWHSTGRGVTVDTDQGTFTAGSLVLTAGPWAGSFLAELNIPLKVLRKHLHWYAASDACYREDDGCPAFFYELPEGYFYGFPEVDSRGVKVAEHSGGTRVADPLTVDRGIEIEDRDRVEQFVSSCLPGVTARATDHAVCMYTMSPDEHFVVDRHPRHANVVFAAGMSGHGFKFTPVLGEALADLCLNGSTELLIDFLSVDRLG